MLRRFGYLFAGFLMAIILIGGGYLAGAYSRERVQAAVSGQPYPLLSEAQQFVDQFFFKAQPSPTVREYGAIKGMLATLGDKYSFFIDPPVAASESNVLAGTYGGIGVQIRRDEKARFVLFPFRDSPAYQAGVRDNDLLIAVNKTEVPLSTQEDAVDQLLRGEVKGDNGVTLTVRHQPGDQTETFTIKFAVIGVPSVTWRTLSEAPDIGYLQILRFTNRTPYEVKAALGELNTASVRYLILDMRNNPGGLLDECVKVAGQFVNGGPVFIEKTRDTETINNAPDNSALTALPMVILVNKGTASAAELVAGALRDRGRAILIGQQTYGKGSVQLILQLSDKSSIHITTAEWFPPSHTQLDGTGLTPEIAMIPDPAGRDVELGEAIRQVRTRK